MHSLFSGFVTYPAPLSPDATESTFSSLCCGWLVVPQARIQHSLAFLLLSSHWRMKGKHGVPGEAQGEGRDRFDGELGVA